MRHVPVESRVRQDQHPYAIEVPGRLEVKQCLLDRPDRHTSIHRVLGQRESVDVVRLSAGQDTRIVVRFMAVTVDQHDVTGLAQCLPHDLVRGGRAIRGEEGMVGAEGPRGEFLGMLDVALGLQKAVQPTGGRR